MPSKIAAPSSELIHGLRSAGLKDSLVLIIVIVLALALRISLLDFKSLDYYASLKPWYNTIMDQGFSAFSAGFSTYNPPYLYLLYLIARFFPDLPVVVAIKLPSLIADYVCAYLVFLIVRGHWSRNTVVPALAAVVVLFAPSVVLNSAFWGQADSLFAAGILACIYFLTIRRPNLAMLAFGIALAFKLQAIFLAPVLIALFLRGTLPWKSFLFIPFVLLLAVIPAWIAGRPIGELLGVYAFQASQFQLLTMNAPSAYAWLPGTNRVFNLLYAPGVTLGAAAAFIWLILVYKSLRKVEGRLLLEVALVCMLIVPLFLPKMHERYFYPADVLSIPFAFLYPGLFYVPILIGGVSFLSYQPFLFEREFVPLPILAFILLLVTATLGYHTARQLYTGSLSDQAKPTNGSPDTTGDHVVGGGRQ